MPDRAATCEREKRNRCPSFVFRAERDKLHAAQHTQRNRKATAVLYENIERIRPVGRAALCYREPRH